MSLKLFFSYGKKLKNYKSRKVMRPKTYCIGRTTKSQSLAQSLLNTTMFVFFFTARELAVLQHRRKQQNNDK